MPETTSKISESVENLFCKDNNLAYESLKLLLNESEKSNEVYKYFDRFSQMIDDANSYIRTRGLLLICANAKWDDENRLNAIIGRCLPHILDEKPITSRQFIKALPEIAKHKPSLASVIREALLSADTRIYPDTMKSLVAKDIADALKKIG